MRLPALLACLGLAACGRYNLPRFASEDGATPTAQDAAAEAKATIGPVDLTKAPATLPLSCDGVTASLAFKMPCLVGLNLAGSGTPGPGYHATECRMAQPGDPLVWGFVLPLSALAQNPDLVLSVPGQLPPVPPGTGAIDLGTEKAHISSVTGSLSFSRVDPQARAFEGSFTGTLVLKGETSGAETTCHVDGPFWGAPGGFL